SYLFLLRTRLENHYVAIRRPLRKKKKLQKPSKMKKQSGGMKRNRKLKKEWKKIIQMTTWIKNHKSTRRDMHKLACLFFLAKKTAVRIETDCSFLRCYIVLIR